MSELQSVLDALAADDLDAPPPGELLDRIQTLAAARNRIAALLTGAVRRAEPSQAVEHEGLTSIRSWLRTHVRLSGGAARRLVVSGRSPHPTGWLVPRSWKSTWPRWRPPSRMCERHHGEVHHGFRIERGPGARWRTYRPGGTEM